MKVIILAAGRGSRLYPLTLNKPKGLLDVGGETILDRLIRQFRDIGVSDILMVVGYQKEHLTRHFGDSVRYKTYEDFSKTNNFHTLWSVREELDDDVIIVFADLVVHHSIVNGLIESQHDITMAVDTSQVLEGTMRVSVKSGYIDSITSTSIEEANGNFIGMAKVSKAGCRALLHEMSTMINGHFEDYYTVAVDQLARRGIPVSSYDVRESIWREIDTKEEYDELLSIYDAFE